MSEVLSQLGDGPQPDMPVTPVVVLSNNGYEVTWPNGQPERFLITTSLFEAMIEDINEGRQAVAVLIGITNALKTLGVPSTSSPAT